MNAPSPSTVKTLRELISDEAQREIECQAYLAHAHPLLAPPFSRVVQVVREQVAMAGRSDYFILCEVTESTPRRRLILWEAKAPQLAPFEVATRNRLIPSRALVEAENQLLYYFDEYRSSSQFLDRYGLRHADDVKLGGIVIGNDANLVRSSTKNNLSHEELTQLASSALRIRDEHFYRGRIRLLTWDRIAQILDPSPVLPRAG
ncbi:MAG: hypothetical protein RLY71_1304 [Pseudomonadota bacterium]|jgi:hypothetical protein